MRRWPWDVLGIDPTGDEGVVRKAYADALRALDLDKDVKAYADLRRARDEGLWLARQGAREDEDDFGLGSLDDGGVDYAARVDLGFDPASVRFNETTPTPHEEGLDWSQLDPGDAGTGGFDAPPPDQPPQPELSEEQQRARDAWNGLLAILYPDGQYSEEAITLEQLDEGNRYLAALIERADLCDIEEHHALDHGLSQLMAETWPRSAPFVEPAAEAFHWLDESGQIEERPALMFLNLRLRGMRFHEKVQQEGHPLNKAWVELSRPGRAGFIDRWKVKREHVYQLLTGIRERYPEIESYLDAERVASWEYPQESTGGGGLPWWVAIIVIITVLRIASTAGDSSPRPSAPPPPVPTINSPVFEPSAYDARIAALFGEDIDYRAVREIDPVFGDQLHNAMQRERYGNHQIEGFVRGQAYRASTVAEFDELVALIELKQLWLMSAIGSPDLCRNIMTGDFTSVPLDLPGAMKAREAQLLRRLLDAGVLNNLEGRGAGNFSVPGWAIERVMERSGLTEDQVARALQNPDDPSRCRVEMTLIGVVKEEPGRVSAELLRSL